LSLSLQSIVLAARAADIVALHGVWNRLDDPEGLEAECREGRAMGFDGKTVVHPAQIAAANRLFGASPAELEDARALIEAFRGGVGRFRGPMIEGMHVEAAERLIARAKMISSEAGAPDVSETIDSKGLDPVNPNRIESEGLPESR